MGMRMIARCRRRDPWVTVIVALTVLVAVSIADEMIDDDKAAEALSEKVEPGSEASSDKSDPTKDKQYFIYYNARAQDRDDQIVGAEQGRSSDDVRLLYDLIPRNSECSVRFLKEACISEHVLRKMRCLKRYRRLHPLSRPCSATTTSFLPKPNPR